MAMFEYGVGGNEVKIDASEAIADIPFNRTLLVEKLTSDDPVNPEKVEGLTTIEDVFQHYKPSIDVGFENEDGQEINETFRFHSVADFLVKNMTQHSPFLSDLNAQKAFYEKMIKQLRSNKILQRALQNADSKVAFIEALQVLLDELESFEVTKIAED
ncbi:MAG: hypothetical protein LBT25_10360 [Candidatus Symbiothrix sp.]|jgi:hypothetical protein|nr:hypothetical protein [Candidatus Symbiothrix sp.]